MIAPIPREGGHTSHATTTRHTATQPTCSSSRLRLGLTPAPLALAGAAVVDSAASMSVLDAATIAANASPSALAVVGALLGLDNAPPSLSVSEPPAELAVDPTPDPPPTLEPLTDGAASAASFTDRPPWSRVAANADSAHVPRNRSAIAAHTALRRAFSNTLSASMRVVGGSSRSTSRRSA